MKPCKEFKIDEKVLNLFMESPMENLEEFRFYFTGEDQVDAFVAKAAELKDALLRIQVARVRRAWDAVRKSSAKREDDKTTAAVAELDDLLEEATLREVKAQFWMRYKLRYPAEVMPADSLVSRCTRFMGYPFEGWAEALCRLPERRL